MGPIINNKVISLGFSTCPNDTFIFDAMVNGKIDTEGIVFEYIMEDVESLNKLAFSSRLDMTKISYSAFGFLVDKYVLLDAGSALGVNCGPLVVGLKNLNQDSIDEAKVAIPGKYTTANFLFSLAFPKSNNKVEMVFSSIEDAVLNGEVDAGVIIHESRFTYKDKGLKQLMDLGSYWDELSGLPIPLGGIAVKRSLPLELKEKLNRIMKRSVSFALENPHESSEFVKLHAIEMKNEVIQSHIDLYVNDYTVSLNEDGITAVKKLLNTGMELQLIPTCTIPLFVN